MQLSRYNPFPTGAPVLQKECYHLVDGCIVFCISALVGCWLLAGVVQLLGIGTHHLFINWRLNLRSMMVSFSTRKGVFFMCCRSPCGASSYYCCGAYIYIYIYTMLEYNIQVLTIEMTGRKP